MPSEAGQRQLVYLYKRVLPLTHSLAQHTPGDSMEDRFTNFGVQNGFEALNLTKTGFCEIPPPFPPPEDRHGNVFSSITRSKLFHDDVIAHGMAIRLEY